MNIDPSLAGKQPSPFILSIEVGVSSWPTFNHPFHLGTDLSVAKSFAQEIFERCRNGDYQLRFMGTVPQTCCTVAIMRDGKLVDTWDGRDWSSDAQDRLFAEEQQQMRDWNPDDEESEYEEEWDWDPRQPDLFGHAWLEHQVRERLDDSTFNAAMDKIVERMLADAGIPTPTEEEKLFVKQHETAHGVYDELYRRYKS